jgi:hypothetical protein
MVASLALMRMPRSLRRFFSVLAIANTCLPGIDQTIEINEIEEGSSKLLVYAMRSRNGDGGDNAARPKGIERCEAQAEIRRTVSAIDQPRRNDGRWTRA